MIDLILQGTKANIAALLKARGLLDFDADKNPVPVPGCDLAWWGGDGKFMTAAPVLDKGGNVVTPATFLAGYVVNCRIHDKLAKDDLIKSAKTEQWERSKIVKAIKEAGTLGTFGGIPCYTIDNVRLLKADAVFKWCQDNGVPSHEWFGGNQI
jgi:hypothetical protein